MMDFASGSVTAAYDDTNVLKARIISLTMDLSSKDRMITEKETGAENAILEASELVAKLNELKGKGKSS